MNVTNIPDLLRIARQVEATNQPVVLRDDGHDLAVVTPVAPPKRRSGRAKAIGQHDSFAGLIGSTVDAPPTDASRIHEYLAEAYEPEHP